MSLVPEAMSSEPTCTEITKPGVVIEQCYIDDYESDINELLKQKMRHKRRRYVYHQINKKRIHILIFFYFRKLRSR